MTKASKPVPVVKGIPDLYKAGIAKGWKVQDGRQLTAGKPLQCDVLIIGSGAGGGTSAEILSAMGLDVLLVEEGPLQTSNDFDMQEGKAYRNLYQEGTTRASDDGGVLILQGRNVGGTTTVNWTASFRTPPQTLAFWQQEFAVKGLTGQDLKPWFEKMEQRLNIEPWGLAPNPNNAVLSKGCDALKLDWDVIPRNVKGCWNLGYCGMGCPTNAKQSMLVTTIPAALETGARLIHNLSVRELTISDKRVQGAVAVAGDQTIHIIAKHTVVSGGGINSPALLLRSRAPDPYKRLGKRTFLHPTAATIAEFEQRIDGFYGAPQSIYSDHFLWRDGVSGPAGYKLEVPPIHPGFVASVGVGDGPSHAQQMSRLPHLNLVIALLRDGFSDASPGGEVSVQSSGNPRIKYPVNDYIQEAVLRSMATMAEIQFAAGAKAVRPVHTMGQFQTNLNDAKQHIAGLKRDPNRMRVGSAHVMGGCGLGEDPKSSVVNSAGKYHHLEGLHVLDGSIFPTSIGANPQLSIYGIVAKLATQLGQQLAKA